MNLTKLFADLLSTDYGLLSLGVIAITIVMWIYFTVLFMGKIKLHTPNTPARTPHSKN